MHRIIYTSRIRVRGPLGIPFTVVKFRTAHVDDANWRRLRRERFSLTNMMLLAGGAK